MRKQKYSPVEKRQIQIQKQLETLRSTRNQKTRRDFKSDDAFADWNENRERKIHELEEELVIFANPEGYNELPLALGALELGVTLEEIVDFVREDLVQISFQSDYAAGARITRDELARLIDVGEDELRRIANKSVDETFGEAIEFLRNRDVAGAERCLERIERFGYVQPYWVACYTAIEFLKGNYAEVFREMPIDLTHSRHGDDLEAIDALEALRKAIEVIEPTDHLSAVAREQILAVADGKKLQPFEETYSRFRTTEFPSKLNENQRRAMLLSTVVMTAIHKYKFQKSIARIHGFRNEVDEREFETVVRNALYTALEAEAGYDESPSSKFFVDRFEELLPRRWAPAELITFLPERLGSANKAR